MEFVNKGITDKLNPNVNQKHSDISDYDTIMSEVESEVDECLKLINDKKFTNEGLPNYSILKVYQSKDDSHVTSDIDTNFEINTLYQGKQKAPKILLKDSNDCMDNKSDHIASLQLNLEKIKENLKLCRELRNANKNCQVGEIRNVPRIPRIEHSQHNKNLLIHWGDHDWNLILNMMLGIQKSVKATAANLDPTADATKEEFQDRVKHNLLPGNIKNVKNKMYKFRDYAPNIFERIRRLYGVTAQDYTKSLGVEKIMQSLMINEFSSLEGQCSSGKSGSFFYYSDDGEYILKTLKRDEYLFFRKTLSDYYLHILKNPHSLITRYFGFHKIIVSKKSRKMIYFTVMGNVFRYGKEISEVYDLKGSTYGRSTDSKLDSSVARKDLDFLKIHKTISLGVERKRLLLNQLDRDCEFLNNLGIIDYSLLLGISEKRHPEIYYNYDKTFIPFTERDEGGMISSDGKYIYFMGIIDILTYYNTKKKIEHFIKSAIHSKISVSCAPPVFYAKRFITFLDTLIE